MSKSSLKRLAYRLMRLTGVLSLLHWLQRDHITILFFHSSLPADRTTLSWVPCRSTLSDDTLRQTLGFLSDRYTFISLDEAEAILLGDRPPVRNGLVVTIDDGYLNNLQVANPLFRDFGVESTVFVVTDTLDDGQAFWFDRLDYLVQQAARSNLTIEFAGQTLELSSDMTAGQLKQACLRVVGLSRDMEEAERYERLSCLFSQIEGQTGKRIADLPQPDLATSLLSPDDIRRAEEEGMHIASHTASHRRLSLLDDTEIEAELARSKARLEAELGYPCRHLAYPEGVYDDRVVAAAKRAGYRLSVTTEPGTNRAGDDMQRLKRFALSEFGDENVFWSNLIGINRRFAQLRR